MFKIPGILACLAISGGLIRRSEIWFFLTTEHTEYTEKEAGILFFQRGDSYKSSVMPAFFAWMVDHKEDTKFTDMREEAS